jgi:hypothetical protein
MRITQRIANALLIALLAISVPISTSAQSASTTAKPRQNLTTSSDGKFLVDPTGKNVMQYLDSAKAFVPMSVPTKQGAQFNPAGPVKASITFYPCNCRNECAIYDANGKCVSTYRHCDICTKETPD